jgi:hypothetical protein
MDGDRLFSDKEVEAVLARAVELSRGGEGRGPRSEGTRLADLERIAAEAGLPADAIGRAVSELSAEPRPAVSSLRRLFGVEGGKARLELKEAPSASALNRLLLVLPDLAKQAGGSGSVADGILVWRGDRSAETQNGSSLRIELGPNPDGRGGYVEISLSVDGAAGGIYGGVIGGLGLGAGLGVGLGLGIGALHSPAFAILVPFGALALSFIASRSIVGAVSAWARRKVERLRAEIARRLGA